MRRRYGFVFLGVAAAIGIGALALVRAQAADPNALWQIVHDRCVPDQQAHDDPAPCARVDLTGGWAVLKDIVGQTQFLLIPTARVSGIEDPQILEAGAPNYWLAAWDARRFVEQRAPAPLARDDISLAINAAVARSQNQLHIHVDCVRVDVRAALRAAQPRIGASWSPIRLLDQEYRVRRLSEDELRGTNLFALVAKQLPEGEGMNLETMVLVGARWPDGVEGFALLAGRAGTGGNQGHGEDLQDHACALAAKPS